MTVMDERTIAAVYTISDNFGWRFEGKKDALRQTQDGHWKLGFTVAHEDLPKDISHAPMGTRYLIIALPPPDEAADRPVSPPAEQAAIPRDRVEHEPLHKSDYDRSERQKLSTEAERAVTRCAILCNDRQFLRWFGCPTTEEAAAKMRLLVGGSRTLIATDRRAFDAFLRVETSYREECGLMAARR